MLDFQHYAICKRRVGFSLVELTVMVLVLGILTAVAMPVYSNSLLKYRCEVAAQRIQQDVIQAQQLARLSNSSQSVTFNATANNYTLSGLSSLDHPGTTYTIALGQPPYSVDISSLVAAAQPTAELTSLTLTFNRFGMPDQAISLIVQAGDCIKRVDVALTTGKVSLQ